MTSGIASTAIRDVIAALGLFPPGVVREIRVPEAGRFRTISGYFNDAEAFERSASYLDRQSHPGIYVTSNPCRPDLLARSANRTKNYTKDTTSDHDIVKRDWLLIDVDPKRPRGVSSTDEEKAQAHALVLGAREFLHGQGWPDPALIDSGNGFHLWYRLDLANDDEALSLIKGVLASLAATFDRAGIVTVDTSVSNASRIVKLPGTMSRKGEDVPDRPHRRSALLEVPDQWVIVSVEQLRALAAATSGQDSGTRSPSRPRAGLGHQPSFDLERWIAEHDLPVTKSGPWRENGYRWELANCPWNPEHTNGGAFVGRHPSGAIMAGCLHESCREKNWHDLRDVIEPGWREKKSRRASGNSGNKPPHSVLAAYLAVEHGNAIAFDDSSATWREYGNPRHGIWGAITQTALQARVRRELDTLLPEGYAASVLAGVIMILKADLAHTAWDADPLALPVANGVLQLDTLTLLPHDPKNHVTWSLPYPYDPAAPEPGPIFDFLVWAMDDDPRRAMLLLVWLAAVVRGRTDLQRFIECLGPGGSGKGTYLRLATALVGDDNAHVTTLEQLEANRFESASLKGKPLVLITDSERFGGEVALLKALTGGDRIRDERKHVQPGPGFLPRALVMIAANEPFRASDQTSGLARRRLTVPFAKQVAEDQKRDLTVDFAPHLPGLLNTVLAISNDLITTWIRSPLRFAPGLLQAKFDVLRDVNPLADWAEQHLVADPDGKLYVGNAERITTRYEDGLFRNEETWLYASYCAFCVRNGRKQQAARSFSGLLLDLCVNQLHVPGVGRGRDAGGAYCTGLSFKPRSEECGLVLACLEAQFGAMTDLDGSLTAEIGADVGSDANDAFLKLVAIAHAHTHACTCAHAHDPEKSSEPVTCVRSDTRADPSRHSPVSLGHEADRSPVIGDRGEL